METTTTNTFVNDIAPLPEKPQFLKVLCILTWVCCGLMLLSSVSGLLMQPSEEQRTEQIEKMREISPEAADKMEAAFNENTPTQRTMSALLNIVAIFMSAAGAMFMWKLESKGFYLYILGEALPYLGFAFGGAAAISAAASMAGSMGSAVIGMVIGFMVLLDIVFIVLYALNLKHMTK